MIATWIEHRLDLPLTMFQPNTTPALPARGFFAGLEHGVTFPLRPFHMFGLVFADSTARSIRYWVGLIVGSLFFLFCIPLAMVICGVLCQELRNWW